MTTQEKKNKVQQLAEHLLKESLGTMIEKVEKALNSGAINVDTWDEVNNNMILPKCIVSAILKNEAYKYEAKGCSFEKKVKNEIKNIQFFI